MKVQQNRAVRGRCLLTVTYIIDFLKFGCENKDDKLLLYTSFCIKVKDLVLNFLYTQVLPMVLRIPCPTLTDLFVC